MNRETGNYKDNKREENGQENAGFERLIVLAREYPGLWEEIAKKCIGNDERYELLCEILRMGQTGSREEMIAKIYRYGSMIDRQDLIGRQIFLWLSKMAGTLKIE